MTRRRHVISVDDLAPPFSLGRGAEPAHEEDAPQAARLMKANETEREPSLLRALDHLDRGEWQQAHTIVQQLESREACWLHGIVHILEGDMGNARYWYGRAQRAFSEDAAAERAAARSALTA